MLCDVLQSCDLHAIIPVSLEEFKAPAFERLGVEVLLEEQCFDIRNEAPVLLLAPDLQSSADVLQEVDVAELDDAARVHVPSSHADRFVVIADHSEEVVTGILELGEVLHPCLVILARSEEADRDVVGQVVHAVEQRKLLRVSLYFHVLPVDDEETTEALGIAVGERDIVVVRELQKLPHHASVRRIDALANAPGERANARALDVCEEERFFLRTVINAETGTTILATVTLQASARAIPFRVETATRVACKTAASRSPFLRVNMFKVGKMACSCYRVSFSDTHFRTLSKITVR